MKGQLIIVDEVDSTNLAVRKQFSQLPDGSLFCALSQSAGRGRLNRRWITSSGSAICATGVFKDVDVPFHAGAVIALAALELISGKLGDERAYFKWPNDIYIGSRKLAGILSEGIFEKGKITRIDGMSGLGKSTLLKLIMGDYQPLEGTISYGGISISQFRPAEWRDMAAYVEQRPAILNASILENITLGKENPDISRVLEICRELNMDQMISRFPQGLLTNAGSGGMGLSGGECQKIGIARALYKDPRIYIFDEATSSMDPASEECAARCIYRLRDSGKTVIAVSHKGDGAIIADNVVQLK